jgi:hypothetical protein
MQIQADINAVQKLERKEKKRKSKHQSKVRPGESQKSKSGKPATTSVDQPSMAKVMAKKNTSKQLAKPSDVKPPISAPVKRKKHDGIIVGLRYKTQAISHLTGFEPNATLDRFRVRSHHGTRKSTPVARSTTSHRPRVKNKNDAVIRPPANSRGSPESPSGSAPDSLFDVGR